MTLKPFLHASAGSQGDRIHSGHFLTAAKGMLKVAKQKLVRRIVPLVLLISDMAVNGTVLLKFCITFHVP